MSWLDSGLSGVRVEVQEEEEDDDVQRTGTQGREEQERTECCTVDGDGWWLAFAAGESESSLCLLCLLGEMSAQMSSCPT